MIERYQSPAVAGIFSDETRFGIFLEIEALLLEELAKKYPIAAGEIARLRKLKNSISTRTIRRLEAETRHEITAFLEWIWSEMPQAPGIKNFLHLGLTSSDLMDTALAVQSCRAIGVVLKSLEENLKILETLAQRYKNLAVMGRTHGMHAEITSLGFKFLGFWCEGRRNKKRMEAARQEIAVGKLSGSVGNFASSAIDPAAEERLLAKLGLCAEPAATQVVARDRHAVVLARLAIVGGWVERIATELRHLQRTEVAEAGEPFSRGQHGSSSMPHKRNPVLCENLCGLARLLRSYALTAMENMALWHERDISHSSAERVAVPDAFHLAHFMMIRLKEILSGLTIDREKIRANFRLTGEATFSQAYLNALIAAGMSRKQAYAAIQAASGRAAQKNTSLLDELLADPAIPKKAKLKKLQPEDLLAQVPVLFKRSAFVRTENQGRRARSRNVCF